ncbi:MAG: hypothetical protein JNL25_01525 [Rhodospirillaceae bacterium]|nr:hypothetical protein [Rhodospirillaceae bacterium]
MFEALLNASDEEKMRFIVAVMKSSEAGQLLESGNHAAGIAAYREAIALCPPCPTQGDYHLLLGCHFFAEGDVAAAEAEILQALPGEGCSYPYEAHRRLAFVRAALGRFPEALSDLAMAAELGEDAAFVAQATAIYHLALGEIDAAEAAVAPRADHADCDLAARCRLALVRAEIARLQGDAAGCAANCTYLAEMAGSDGLGAELGLSLAVLDRADGRPAPRDVVAKAFADQPDWAAKAWTILLEGKSAIDLMEDLESLSWGERAENLCQFHRLAGLLAETQGDVAAARRHYQAARSEPFTQWCLDHHLAGMALAQLEGA